jgi:hypothetical protein
MIAVALETTIQSTVKKTPKNRKTNSKHTHNLVIFNSNKCQLQSTYRA